VRNRGELAEGWYDPETLQKATQNQAAESAIDNRGRATSTEPQNESPRRRESKSAKRIKYEDEDNTDSDDSIGPALPGQDRRLRGGRMGPSIPNMQDLELKRGTH
jgi:hypothetical protein